MNVLIVSQGWQNVEQTTITTFQRGGYLTMTKTDKMIKLYNYYEIMYRRHYSVCKNSQETDIYQAKLSAVKECLDIMTEDNTNDRQTGIPQIVLYS